MVDDGVVCWLVLGPGLLIPVPNVNDLENETLVVIDVNESACLEALPAPVSEEVIASGDVVT